MTMEEIDVLRRRQTEPGKKKQQLRRCPRHIFNYNKPWRVYGEVGVGGVYGCSCSDWLQLHCPYLDQCHVPPWCVSALEWKERCALSTSHHGKSPGACSLAHNHTLFCVLSACLSSGHIYTWVQSLFNNYHCQMEILNQ